MTQKQRTRMTPDARRAQLLAAALVIAEKDGFHTLTRPAVAAACDVTPMTINLRFGSMADLRAAVLKEAKRLKKKPILDSATSVHGNFPARV